MITLKPIVIDSTGWLEATWIEQETQIWCQSYHPTQIAELRAKAAEYGTPLDEQLLDAWVASYEPPIVTSEQKRANLISAVTALRWEKETGGLMLQNGVTIGTRTEDQNRITSVIANAQLAGVEVVDFKTASGWVALTLADVQAIAGAIALHVQACFSAERAHHEAIAALDAAELDNYDITTGWPQ